MNYVLIRVLVFSLLYVSTSSSSLDSLIFAFVLKIWQTDPGDVATLDGEDLSNVVTLEHVFVFLHLQVSNCTILLEISKIEPNIKYGARTPPI